MRDFYYSETINFIFYTNYIKISNFIYINRPLHYTGGLSCHKNANNSKQKFSKMHGGVINKQYFPKNLQKSYVLSKKPQANIAGVVLKTKF